VRETTSVLVRTLLAFGLSAGFAVPGLREKDRPPQRWEIEIRLTTEGRYSVREGSRSFSGDFLYEAAWSGSMERDDDDFLLTHIRNEIVRWELEENAESGEGGGPSSLKELPEKPVFRMNYILTEGSRLRFDFTVEGFAVPRASSANKFELALPRTKSGAPDADYDSSVIQGSNDVCLRVIDIGRPRVERSFRWRWKDRKASPGPSPEASFIGSSETLVRVKMTARD
jgi:hypothetical protein